MPEADVNRILDELVLVRGTLTQLAVDMASLRAKFDSHIQENRANGEWKRDVALIIGGGLVASGGGLGLLRVLGG